MSDLLHAVLDAHGGAGAFARAQGISARISFGGPFWAAHGWPDALTDVTVFVDTRRQHIRFDPYPTLGLSASYDAAGSSETVRIVDAAGVVSDERLDPRPGFPAYSMTVPWDAMQNCYFAGVATWNYLMEPFLFTWPGVTTAEIEPWAEPGSGGQVWRRLAVTFPADLPNHNPDQVFYFDDRFLLRRMDYQPDVTGAAIAHYTHEPRMFDGLVFYTRRCVHPRGPDGVANQGLTAITIDIASVSVD